MSVEIHFQDEHFIAAEKPSGLLVHPYRKETNEKECLLKELRDMAGQYLYPVHRIDRPVSGIVIFARSSEAARKLQETWSDDNTEKIYLALINGVLKGAVILDAPLLSQKKIKQEALTLARPTELFREASLMEVEIKSGRRHQIRRHFATAGKHVVGDRMYGKKRINDYFLNNFGVERTFLHSHKLQFNHPFSNEKVKIVSPLPDDLAGVLEKMRKSA